MLVVMASAVAMTGWFIARGHVGSATFLLYLVVITATACWNGWRATRLKRDPGAYYGRGYRALVLASLVLGLVVFAIGVALGSWLLMLFCWIGVFIGVGALRGPKVDPASDRRWWMREHYGAMLGNGVATHVAFLNLGLGRLLEPFGLQAPQLLGWLAPVGVAMLAGVWLDRKYGGRGVQVTDRRATAS